MLRDEESFVYLNVLHAIGGLANSDRARVFDHLLAAFSADLNNISPILSLRHRGMVGEALAVVLRRAGDAAPPLVPRLVSACLRVVRTRPTAAQSSAVESKVNLLTMRISKDDDICTANNNNANNDNDDVVVDDDDDDEDNAASRRRRRQNAVAAEAKVEAKIEASRRLTDFAALSADAILLRQSAVSLLAESMAAAGWSAARHLADVLDVAIGILTMEAHQLQSARASRRSAAFLLRYTLAGLHDKIFVMDDGDHLEAAYRVLKLACRDRDEVVAFHSEAGIAILEEIMISLLTPEQPTNPFSCKITIL